MKRAILTVCLLAAAVFVGTTIAKPPPVVYVQNPMTDDLYAATWNINNVSTLTANHVVVRDDLFFSDTDIVIGVHPGDPRVTGYNRAIGSLFISKPGGEWYRKTGPTDFDWTCVAGCAP